MTKATFYPFLNDFTYVNFSLSRPTEVTLNVGDPNLNERTKELLLREPLGAGSHSVVWDGLDDTGQFAVLSPGSYGSFFYAAFGYYMPDNTIFVNVPSVANQIDIDPATVRSLLDDLNGVITVGTAKDAFKDFGESLDRVGGKTGTGQTGQFFPNT